MCVKFFETMGNRSRVVIKVCKKKKARWQPVHSLALIIIIMIIVIIIITTLIIIIVIIKKASSYYVKNIIIPRPYKYYKYNLI